MGLAKLVGAERFGLRRFGVPPGGPWDRESAWLANALVGNPKEAPIWEWALGPLTVAVDERVALGIVGAEESRVVILEAGEPRTFGAPIAAVAYLAIGQGDPARFQGRQLAELPRSHDKGNIRVLPGPQAHLLDFDAFVSSRYLVDPRSDRMGHRLIGPGLDAGREIASEPACVGAVQIANDGQAIVIGPDGPTIGGYPKVAVVCDADLGRLAQRRPGEEVAFVPVSASEAAALREEWRVGIGRRLAALAAAR